MQACLVKHSETAGGNNKYYLVNIQLLGYLYIYK